jgi:hypothetical protein
MKMFPSVGAKRTTLRAPRRKVQTFRNSKIRRNSHICIELCRWRITPFVDVDLMEGKAMDRRNETIGVRRTGWAALDRDPQRDTVEFTCPHCGAQSQKTARRERAQYHFTDGFLQDLQGEATHCKACNGSLRIVPVVMLHDQDETRRFEAVFSEDLAAFPLVLN